MTDIANRLKLLREEGHQIISPTFTISYNPYTDAFLMDVPEDMKFTSIAVQGETDVYNWDCSALYPIEVCFDGDYNTVWNELQSYINGATIDLLPTSYIKDGQEYIWIDNENTGCFAVRKSDLKIIE